MGNVVAYGDTVATLIVRVLSMPYVMLSSVKFYIGGVEVNLWMLAVSSLIISILVGLFVRSAKA